jgi:hypothetical protein
MFVFLATSILPVSGQGAQTILLTVQTDETILGRFTSLTQVPEIGAYSVTITRSMSVQPAKVGDILRHGDIITLQRGAFANIQLVDRTAPTMLGGGTDGLAARIERTGGTSGVKPVLEEPIETKVFLIPAGDGKDIGRISYVQGRAFIQRSNRLIPASVGEALIVGDKISCDKGSFVMVAFTNRDEDVTFTYGTIWTIQREKPPESQFEPVILFFKEIPNKVEGIWLEIVGFISQQSAKVSDAGAGVRG